MSTIKEILDAHQKIPGHYDCQCGWERLAGNEHRDHLVEVLEAHVQEREAAALEDHADAIQHIDDVILREAEKGDRWFDFQDAERDYTRNYNQEVSYYSANEHYARYRAKKLLGQLP